jgi:transposase
MAETSQAGCPNCEKLTAQLAALEKRLAELEKRYAELEAKYAKAIKNSANSSKPPSSDFTVPPKRRRQPGKRRPGGQPGHPRHERQDFSAEEIDRFQEYSYDACPDCGGGLKLSDADPYVIQQVEIIEKPTIVTEHVSLAQWCEHCQKTHHYPFPRALYDAGLVGPRLTALVAYMKGPCHASYSTIRKFFRDVIGFRISRGQLAKLVHKATLSLAGPYEELLAMLPREAVLNTDETGHKDCGERLWTWCFRAACYTLYKIDSSRGSDVLLEVLGSEFNGVLGCDYFSAYRKYMRLNENVTVQFCLAHLIRDVKFLVSHPDSRNRRYGRRLRDDLKRLFSIIHRREHYCSPNDFRLSLQAACSDLLRSGWAMTSAREAGNIRERFLEHGDQFITFLTTPSIEPTNNLAEQAIRFVAIHRRMTQGTRGDKGQRWLERIFTVVATCQQQGRSVFDYLCQAVNALLERNPPPSLLPEANSS